MELVSEIVSIPGNRNLVSQEQEVIVDPLVTPTPFCILKSQLALWMM